MAKASKKSSRAKENGHADDRSKGAHGPRRTLKNRKQAGEFYPVLVYLLPDDLEKLKAIDDEFLCDSESIAARIAIKRWHRYLDRQSKRPAWVPPDRPEYLKTASPNSGGKQTKLYCTKEDMARFDELFILTGRKGYARQVRASIGWLYENL